MNANKSTGSTRIQQILGLIDLTDLSDNCDQAAIDALCAQADTPAGFVAAVCIWPEFVAHANDNLDRNSPVKIATVVNFPTGEEPEQDTCSTIDRALSDGAHEIDYVLPYRALLNGNTNLVVNAIKRIRKTTPDNCVLKIILETGELKSTELIRLASHVAIDQGADFIKTSTGKVPVNATPEAAATMLDAIVETHRKTGFKASGGIRSIDDADTYLKLAEQRLGTEWPDPDHFRFGASGLLQDALARLNINKLNDQQSPSSDNSDCY